MTPFADRHTGGGPWHSEFSHDPEFEESLDMLLAPDTLESEIRRGRLGRRPRAPRTSYRRGRPARRHPRPRPPRPPHGPKPPRPPHGPWRPHHRPLILGRRQPQACVCPPHRTEFVRWVQSRLNRIQGSHLVLDGVMNRAARDELRRFQALQGLPADGIAGPDTERALMAATAGRRSTQGELPLGIRSMAANDGYPQRELEEEFRFSDFPEEVLKPLREGKEKTAVQKAVAVGKLGENLLSDLVFFHRHPARGGRLIQKGEPDFNTLSSQWLTIRDTMVRPVVAAAFFAAYELRFNPGPCPFCINANPIMSSALKTQRRSDVMTLVGVLQDRRDKRAAAALKRKLPSLSRVRRDIAADSLFSRIQRLSSAQLALFKEFFPTPSGGINFNGFQSAFELFANGRLRDPAKGGGFGEPNGGFYFLFAEFAFLCLDARVDKTLWAKALRALVKTQEIFMHVYREAPHVAPPPVGKKLPKPGAAVRSLSGFHFSNFDGTGRSGASRSEALRNKYEHKGVPALKRAARDNLLRAQRMP